MKVLIVDDNMDQAESVARVLEAFAPGQFRSRVAFSLKSALTAIGKEPPHVVLLDLYLGDSKGGSTAYALRKEYPGLPIVALTGMSEELIGDSAADSMLDKMDASPRQLIRAILLAIDKRRAEPLLNDLGQAQLATEHIVDDIGATVLQLKQLVQEES